jgi:hypothetical protein
VIRAAATALSLLPLAAAAGCAQASGASPRRGAASSATAASALAALPVKGRAPKTGYARVRDFGPAWTDATSAPGGHYGCNTRDQVLFRDLTAVRFKGTSHCTVAAGTLADPYTGRSIAFVRGPRTSAAVQIDHLVSLGDSWQTGAQQLTQAQREALANDPLNLLAVDGPANEAKGDGDAATWLPANKSVRCMYVARQIAVKTKFGLWLTAGERNAMSTVLKSCPNEPLPTETSPGVVFKH